MNKKIKMIELLNMIYKGELKDKQKFRVHFKNGLTRDIYYKKIYGKNISSLCNWYDNYTFQDEYDLDDEVEILEDNTEDKGYELLKTIKNENNFEGFEDMGYEYGKFCIDFYKGVRKAFENELKKEKKNE